MNLRDRILEAQRTELEVVVYGHAQPAGSKRAFVKGGFASVVDANPGSKDWKNLVGHVAGEAWVGRELLGGALELELTFYRSRPKAHLSSKAGVELKPSAPPYPITRPDTTKLIRGVEDALTGIVWRDDAQIVRQLALKLYGEPERVEITVRRMR